MPDIVTYNATLGQSSLGNAGSVVAPGATTTIVSLSLAYGLYVVNYGVIMSGTAETQLTNLQLMNFGGSPILTIPSMSHSGQASQMFSNGGGILIRTNLAATAGAIYTAWINATRIV
jgi:hypothetical protein